MIGVGFRKRFLSEEEIKELVEKAVIEYQLKGKKILVIIPDYTRTAPVGFFFKLFHQLLLPQNKRLDYLIALGTHPPMTQEKINLLLEISPSEREEKYQGIQIYNHHWDKKEHLVEIGEISAEEVAEISRGLLTEKVRITINKLIFQYDQLIVLGPTFPHEVVGFSGGNKYFFPGISGPEITHFFHWLGALFTNPVINGTKNTPVRKIVDRAASFIKIPKICFSLVVSKKGLCGLYIDLPELAFDRAADLSAQLHITYCDQPFQKVLSIAPPMYDELWTAGKCMYKLEPVVAEGGELIIYAPSLKEISLTHGKIIRKIGYHTRDYFLKQWDRFKGVPRGVMAHSTHVKGIGTFEGGVEKPRITVTLATAIPAEVCEQINLGYRDPRSINPTEWANREKEGILVVPHAGEILYKLKNKP
jgi:nickel-dependent lactate racemase